MKINETPRAFRRPFLRILAAGLILGGVCLGMSSSAAPGGDKIYWHFTLRAMINPGGDSSGAEEWLWATMVEMTKEEVNPELAETVKAAGGAIPGTVLAHVRAAAWRGDFKRAKDRKCEGRPSKIETSWRSSWSEKVYTHGQVQGPIRDRMNNLFLFSFRFGLCDGLVLLEDGQRRDIADLVNPIVGPIYHGDEREEMPDKIRVLGIIYDDLLVHYKYCGRTWSDQALTPLMHYAKENLHNGFLENPDKATGLHLYKFYGNDIQVIWHIDRSSSRDHPEWKQKL